MDLLPKVHLNLKRRGFPHHHLRSLRAKTFTLWLGLNVNRSTSLLMQGVAA
jgi:hypothetical protein